ncbi:hypothetical protein [Mycolicibacterium houstonense]|uniref:hypothetical protein n=1 Tax=Mycolicibacterium houstonense TaxID=146021 RepID=UPI003F999247
MRLMTSETYARVTAAPDSVRPIRVRVGPVQLGMNRHEAIELAGQLIDTVDQLPKDKP